MPDSDVARLLYDMGRTGTADIDRPVMDVVQDRVYRVFSSKNTNTISANREPIQEEAQKFVGEALRNNFGIELISLQIPQIAFSETFTESNALAVTAKNQAIREENQLKVVGYIADQRVRDAQGQRDQAIAEAEGRARSARACRPKARRMRHADTRTNAELRRRCSCRPRPTSRQRRCAASAMRLRARR